MRDTPIEPKKIECPECEGHRKVPSSNSYCYDCNYANQPDGTPIADCAECDSANDCPNCGETGKVEAEEMHGLILERSDDDE
jgi:hypothetical protein